LRDRRFVVEIHRLQRQRGFGAFRSDGFRLDGVGFIFDFGGALICRFAEQAVRPRRIFRFVAVAAGAQGVLAWAAKLGGRLDFPLLEARQFFVQIQAVQIQLGGAPLLLADGARLGRFDVGRCVDGRRLAD